MTSRTYVANTGRDFYEVLGIERDATPSEIKRAYRTLALRDHPDRNGGSAEAAERFRRAAEAFGVLSDPARRALYDVYGPGGAHPETTGSTSEISLADALERFVHEFRSMRPTEAPRSTGGADRRDSPAGNASERGPEIPHTNPSEEFRHQEPGKHTPPPPRTGGRPVDRRSWIGLLLASAAVALTWALGASGISAPASSPAGPWNMELLLAGLLFLATASVGGLVLSWLLSCCKSQLLEVLGEARTRVADARSRTAAGASVVMENRIERFVASWAKQPRRSLVVQLQGILDAVEKAGGDQVSTLARLEAKLSADIAALREAAQAANAAPRPIPEALRKSSRSAREGLWLGMIVLLTTGALGMLNVSLLSQAFRSVIPPEFALPAALAHLDAAELLALAISLGTIALGISTRALEKINGDGFYVTLFRVSPTLLLCGLAAVGGLSYSLLGAQLDFPARMGIDSSHPLHTVAQYTPTLFGGTVPLLLAALGSALWLNYRRIASARADLAVERILRRYSRRLGSVQADIDRTRARLDALRVGADAVPTGLVAHFERATGFGSGSASLTDALRQSVVRLQSNGTAEGLELRPRSRSELMGNTAVHLLILALWVAAEYLLYTTFVIAIEGTGSSRLPGAAVIASAAVCLSLALGGLLTQGVIFGSGRATLIATAAPHAQGRRATSRVAMLMSGLGVVLAMWASIHAEIFGGSVAANALFGASLSVSAVLASYSLDRTIASFAMALCLSIYSLGWVACRSAEMLLQGIEGALGIARFVIRLASVPGEWLRTAVDVHAR